MSVHTDDDYQRLAEHLADNLRRWVPPGARITLTLRGPDIDAGGRPTEIALTWELPGPPVTDSDRSPQNREAAGW